MKTLSWRVLLSFVFLAVAHDAHAEDQLSWTVTETLIFEWHGETDGFLPGEPSVAHDRDNYLTLKNRANLGLRAKNLDFTFRFDQSSFWRTCPTMPTENVTLADIQGCRSPQPGVLQDDYRIERATARIKLGRHRLTVGDFPLQVGRGLILSLRKVSEFGIDDALRGLRVKLRLHDHVRLDVFGGLVNISNLDEVTNSFVDETRDRLAGGRIEGRILDVATVGAHTVMLFPLSSNLEQQDFNNGRWTALAGGTIELPNLWDRFSIFLEADGLLRTPVDSEAESTEGFAVYSALDLDLQPVTLLGEFKWYQDFEVAGSVYDGQGLPRPLSQPPTIEREDQLILNNTNVLGGRLRADINVIDQLLLFANVAYVHGRNENRTDTFHGYAGAEYRVLEGRINGTISAGYRRVFTYNEHDDLSWSELSEEIIHGETKATARLVGRHGIHLTYGHETWHKPGVEGDVWYHRGTFTFGYDYGSTLSVSIAYEYDTEFDQNHYIIETDELDPPGIYDVPTSIRQHFVFGEVRYTPLRWLDVRLRGGTQRGGLRCLSGVCRVFPNFTGVRFETVIRY